MRRFTRDALRTDLLSKEHVPPCAVGPKLMTITCKRCNNNSGAALERDLAEHFRIQDFLNRKESSRSIVRVQAGHGKIRARLEFKEQGISIFAENNLSNPKHKRNFYRYLEDMKGKEGWKLRVQKQFRYRHSRYLVAILRAAYLIMFHYFGYEYILNPNLEPVRQQIKNPDQTELAKYAVLRINKGSPPPGFAKTGVSVATSPPELCSFLVTLALNRARPKYYGVAMPGLTKKANQVYKEYSNMKNKDSLNLKLVAIRYNPKVLTDITLRGLVSKIWQKVGLHMPE